MKNTIELTIAPPKKQPVLNFRDDFCDLLMKALHPFVGWNFQLEGRYMLIVNILDRSSHESIERGNLVYGGMLAQREIFENKYGHSPVLKHPLGRKENPWEFLENTQLPVSQGVASKSSAEVIEKNISVLDNIEVNYLKDYFEKYFTFRGASTIEDDYFLNHVQGYEYPILDYYFNLNEDCFISLPLIQMGQFDGTIHLVCEKKDEDKIKNKNEYQRLIQQFSREYEGILLDWDLVGANMEKLSLVEEDIKWLTSEEFKDHAEKVSILKELDYINYYKNNASYFLSRVKQSNQVPIFLKNEHRKRAIISILIDSYAHNISAHSLTVLKWWFQQRASTREVLQDLEKEIKKHESFAEWSPSLKDYLVEKFPGNYTLEDIEKGILRDLARWIDIVSRRMEKGEYLPVRDQFLPLAEQLHPLFKFLLEKGAFWSGITRDQQFGGEIKNLYDVLWSDFINNPLYLGTIAYSEGIKQLNIHLRFYKGHKFKGQRETFRRDYEVESHTDGTLLSGLFATVNVGGVATKNFTHTYVEKSKKYEQLAEKLATCEVFFPGGVVGKHSFFTLIENEIRNVKHFSEKKLIEMRKNGLNLYISIRPGTLSGSLESKKKAKEKQLYKIGVWLGHLSDLYEAQQNLVVRRLLQLKQDIIDPDTNQARLGGNFQDKICSAMLFNNSFISVEQSIETDRNKNYYPWIRSSYSTGLNEDKVSETDYEVKNSTLKQAIEDLSENSAEHAREGYFKKHFHLWQGKNVFHLRNKSMLEQENVARFKMVALADDQLKHEARKAGVIRVLEYEEEQHLDTISAYQIWLNKWLKNKKSHLRMVQGEETTIGHLVFDKDTTQYYSEDDFYDLDEDVQDVYSSDLYHQSELHFGHGGNSKVDSQLLAIRSHGVLSNHFFENLLDINDFDLATISKERTYELLEVLQTKVCIFDKRIAERVKEKNKRDYLKKYLNCGIYWEEPAKWEEVKKEGLSSYHFIVVHLSFIEALKNKQGKKYSEERIVEFIDEQVGDQLSDDCIFVVTTGRGRAKWWRKLESSKYMSYATFRPVEMLIEAVESACMLNDDMNLKFNLVKVLFGS